MKNKEIVSKITLGTAQLGFPYGISNQIGKISSITATEILKQTINMKINSFDTAPNYGKSEELIGNFIQNSKNDCIKITTKIPRIILGNKEKINSSVYNFINQSIKKSSKKLQTEKIPIVLLHNSEDMKLFKDDISSSFNKLKKENKIKFSGVSVYTIEDIKEFLNQNEFDVIQIPINIFNSKIIDSGLLSELKKNNKIIFARSIYLQGLFFLNPKKLPTHLKKVKSKLENLCQISKEYDRSIEDICFSFIRDISEIDSMIIGLESINQLKNNVKLLNSPPLNDKLLNKIYTEFNNISEEIVNPSLWNK
jgi:aryl-alcohol dehydrogenase-like predicted oxidoreductase